MLRALRIESLLHANSGKSCKSEEINDFCSSNNIAAQMMNAGSMMHLIFSGDNIESARDIGRSKVEKEFYLHLLGHNVIVPGIHLAFISFAHLSI